MFIHIGIFRPTRLNCLRVLSSILLIFSCTLSGAADLTFKPLAEQLGDEGEIEVFNGVRPSHGNWDSIFVAHIGPTGSNEICTATLIGPKVFLTAAHCVFVDKNAPASDIIILISDNKLRFKCTIDDLYRKGRHSLDYALCALSPSSTFRPASFDALTKEKIDLSQIKENDQVLITGYGCTKADVDLSIPSITTGPVENIFMIGDETVAFVNEKIMTTVSDEAKEPSLCPGDSGGPVFSGVTTKDLLHERWVRAINSSVSVSTKKLESTMTLLSSQNFRTFLACWRQKNPGLIVRIKKEDGLLEGCLN